MTFSITFDAMFLVSADRSSIEPAAPLTKGLEWGFNPAAVCTAVHVSDVQRMEMEQWQEAERRVSRRLNARDGCWQL